MSDKQRWMWIVAILTAAFILPTFTSGEQKKNETTSNAPVAGNPPGVKIPGLVIDTVAVKPVPTKAGNPVDLTIKFKNKGLTESNPATKFTIACVVKSGGPACPVPNTTRPINKAVPAGETYQVSLAGASGAVAGKYELTIKVEGESSGFTVAIDVAPNLILKAVKDAAAPTSAQ